MSYFDGFYIGIMLYFGFQNFLQFRVNIYFYNL